MARIKLELPPSYSFSTIIPIRITDVNYGGHVGNHTILSLLHEARMQYLKHHGYSEMDFGGASLIMGDVAIEFKGELFYGDEVKVYVAAFDFSRVSFDLAYKLVKGGNEKAVALAKTGMVCFNYEKRKVSNVPQAAFEKLTATQ
jgi:YbgC/YbaW family acyl-CoA thioester hydrolase